MENRFQQINDSKLVLKAAQSVWAANKYFVLACDQEAYRDIRKLLRPDKLELTAAYAVLKRTEEKYHLIPSQDLPQISNALYHMAGYFKKQWSSKQRQKLNSLIKSNPEQALVQLEEQSHLYEIDYLINTRLWKSERVKPFNDVPIPLKHERDVFQTNHLLWEGEHVIYSSE